jgi:hypothetical protein
MSVYPETGTEIALEILLGTTGRYSLDLFHCRVILVVHDHHLSVIKQSTDHMKAEDF